MISRVTRYLILGLLISIPMFGFGQTFSFDRFDYATGSAMPSAGVIADFNGDGKNDLAIGHRYPDIAIFLGQGDGSFSTRLATSLPYENTGMAAADFNGDGKLDLAVTWGYPEGKLTILWGAGDGTFPTRTEITLGYAYMLALTVVAADLNGDGKPDLVTGHSDSNGYATGFIAVHLNNGSGGFVTTNYSAIKSPRSIVAIDANSDGKLDLIVGDTGYPNSAILTYLNSGAGVFTLSATLPLPGYFTQMSGGDFNHDGRFDVVVGMTSDNLIRTFQGNGDGTFTAGASFAASDPESVVVGDFNLDGKEDIAATVTGELDLMLVPGNGDGSFGAPVFFEADFEAVKLITGDLDGNGRPDIVTLNWHFHNISVMLNRLTNVPPSPYVWEVVSPNGAPTAALPSSAYDVADNLLFLVAGQSGMQMWGGGTSDVAMLDGANGLGSANWHPVSPGGAWPPGRWSPLVAYNATHNRLIVHGGAFLGDTWVVTNANGLDPAPQMWQPVAFNAPGLNLPDGAYDETSDTFILVGGGTQGCFGYCPASNEVWVLPGASGATGSPGWRQVFPIGGPPPARFAAVAAYDPASNRLILTTGVGPTGYAGDVWVLTNANQTGPEPSEWMQLPPTDGPQRFWAGGAYDSANNRLFVFGGQRGPGMCFGYCFGNNEVWMLTNANGLGGIAQWRKLPTSGTPPSKRFAMGIGYDGAHGRLIVTAGIGSTGPATDTYVLTNLNQPLNRPPTANAGTDQTLTCGSAGGTAVTLDGSASSDPDGDTLVYTWTGSFPEGNGTVTGVSPSVTLPLGASTLTLTVSDGNGGSASDTVTVFIGVQVSGFFAPMAALASAGGTPVPPSHAFKAGSTLPLKVALSCTSGPVGIGAVAAPAIVGLARAGEALDISSMDLDAGSSNDAGYAFRWSAPQWIYNFSSKGLNAGTYTITIRMPDHSDYRGVFVLR